MIKRVIKEIQKNGIINTLQKIVKRVEHDIDIVKNIYFKNKIDLNNVNKFASKKLYNYIKNSIKKPMIKEIPLYDFIQINPESAVASIRSFELNKSDKPEISIVIPVYNAITELAECLQSISKYVKNDYEIIIADDCSPDEKIQLAFKNHPNIIYIRNKENMGFVLNVNNAVLQASGKYILLLNSDVQILDDVVSILKRELFSDKQVGIAGPKIIFPTGILQEAGCTISKNCSTEMTGIGKNANDKAYNFKRYVDYISGACWLFEKELFEQLNGFDINFAPAYAEDLDFCARVVRSGKKILYVPETTIMHHLSVSSNLMPFNFKYYQSVINKRQFNQKHQAFYRANSKIKPIAFYLPQFHDIKQNSYWWGKNYTEWTATASAEKKFKGHYQPHIPSDLGFYNLMDTKVFEAQATLAKRYSIYGFCFYYYNFGDFELMEEALETFRKSKADIKFCLCWANENWTRRWDGFEEDILMEQKGNDNMFFLEVLKKKERFILDSRYIRIDGKPLILIYRESLFNNINEKLELWRTYWRETHNEELYICATDSMERAKENAVSPELLGFDAAVEFPVHHIETRSTLRKNEEIEGKKFKGLLLDYPEVVKEVCLREHPGYKRFPGCFPSWDNTPRRGSKAVVMRYSHPTAFHLFLEKKAQESLLFSGDERLLFINAWNEWGEGAHLEPDIKYGHSWLSAVDKMVKDN